MTLIMFILIKERLYTFAQSLTYDNDNDDDDEEQQ